MSDMMTFPDTVEEFMEQYKIVDTKQVYTNGTELVPIFRMKQWFEHLPAIEPERKTGEWIDDGLDGIGVMGIEYRWQKCSCCGYEISKAPMQRFPKFCANCGADMRGEKDD